MGERWKPVNGYEGRYEVSDHGRVRSLNYGRMAVVRVLKPYPSPTGYLRVPLSIDGTVAMRSVHVIVLEAFVGPRTQGMVCDHIDSCRANNRPGNLCWVTQKENIRRGRTAEAARRRCGIRHPFSKITEEDVVAIRSRYAGGGITQKKLGKEYGLSNQSVNCIVLRITWKHVA